MVGSRGAQHARQATGGPQPPKEAGFRDVGQTEISIGFENDYYTNQNFNNKP